MSPKLMRLFLILTLVFSFSAQVFAGNERPLNVIFLIGDGMGLAQITATEHEHGKLNLSRFKKIGLQTTTCESHFVTDSAAAGTALATGFKTKKGRIGMSSGKKVLKNMVEYAEEAGKSTGIVVSSTVNHATPGAFTAHVESRYHYNDIIEQQVDAGLEVIIGGGMSNLIPSSMKGSRRKDNKNLLFKLREKMPVIQTIEAFRKLDVPEKLAAILENGALPKASERNYTLGELTRKAIKILNRNQSGFFLLVEGSQIDWAGHDNNYEMTISETVDFDTAVKEALDFAEKDGNTLVVVTSDHECGALTLLKNDEQPHEIKPVFASDYHSGVMMPVYSYGPGSDG
ncbi:MAG: alkaline phosphatase, partial [Candidatus Rifleibacteriota bacterium]